MSPTAKITSRQRPVFWATDEKVAENGQDISYRMARWLFEHLVDISDQVPGTVSQIFEPENI